MKGEWLRKPKTGVAAIFLHGVLSDGETCWKNDNGTYWPELLKKEKSQHNLGIYVFTYRTNIFSGTYCLSDIVDALKEHMKLDDVFACRGLIFVAHSVGGIVARKLLVERAKDFSDRGITIGLFLLASPSLGSRYAEWIKPIAKLFGHSQADAIRFSSNNTWLSDLDRQFMNLKEGRSLNLLGKELIEDTSVALESVIRTQVVEPFSAARYFGEPYKVPGCNHFSIAKPVSAEAVQHRQLLYFISVDMPKIMRDELPDGLSHPLQIERYFRTIGKYRDAYRIIQEAVHEAHRHPSRDGTELIQSLLDFYTSRCRPFFDDNAPLIASPALIKRKEDLDNAFDAIADNGDALDSGQGDRNEVFRELGNNILRLSSELYGATLEFERSRSAAKDHATEPPDNGKSIGS
jgi:hypothetical protein